MSQNLGIALEDSSQIGGARQERSINGINSIIATCIIASIVFLEVRICLVEGVAKLVSGMVERVV